ncbi:helix-turn-helix transcriptional regulator [Teichococcus aestuarii]|uniref:helix-turn-helix transcriptional regulator n=1 Tax=Teichococcus aestuarii TaxID=568898 RepID=UPI00361BE4F4
MPEILARNKDDGRLNASFTGKPSATFAGYVVGMSQHMPDQIAARLRAIRAELGMDQSAFAKWLGVNRTRYVNWENAENKPGEEAMVVLCDKTGVTLDYIYRGRLDAVPTALAIRLTAREQGLDPDAAGFEPGSVTQALARAIRPA